MLGTEQKKLILTLTRATQQSKLNWQKESILAFRAAIPLSVFLIDKYYSLVNNQQITCVNLTIFTDDNKIIDEIIACSAADSTEDFNLFNNLYKAVEQQYIQQSNEKLNPIISRINDSIEKSLHAY
jgi:hypothetical protein